MCISEWSRFVLTIRYRSWYVFLFDSAYLITHLRDDSMFSYNFQALRVFELWEYTNTSSILILTRKTSICDRERQVSDIFFVLLLLYSNIMPSTSSYTAHHLGRVLMSYLFVRYVYFSSLVVVYFLAMRTKLYEEPYDGVSFHIIRKRNALISFIIPECISSFFVSKIVRLCSDLVYIILFSVEFLLCR